VNGQVLSLVHDLQGKGRVSNELGICEGIDITNGVEQPINFEIIFLSCEYVLDA
jgi:hypothetical protein